jgi:hypothetical protein
MIRGGTIRENKKFDLVLVYEGNPANVPAGFREATRLHCPRIVFSSMRNGYIQTYYRTSQPRYSGSVTIVGGASKAGVPTTGVVGGAWTRGNEYVIKKSPLRLSRMAPSRGAGAPPALECYLFVRPFVAPADREYFAAKY